MIWLGKGGGAGKAEIRVEVEVEGLKRNIRTTAMHGGVG